LSTSYAGWVAKDEGPGTHEGPAKREASPANGPPKPDGLEYGRPPTLQEARALAHPLRLRILRLCLDEAMTNKELAAALGERPATVLHHVRTLLATGFLREEPWRSGRRGATEKPYRATGKSAQLDHGMSSGGSLRPVFEAVAAEIDEAGPDAVIEGVRMPMRLGPGQLDELLDQVRALIASFPGPEEYMSATDPEGDPYALLLVLHRRRVPAGETATAGTERGDTERGDMERRDTEREERDRPGLEPDGSE
jgi:DNA-binding transcriptional ArsR family regulator